MFSRTAWLLFGVRSWAALIYYSEELLDGHIPFALVCATVGTCRLVVHTNRFFFVVLKFNTLFQKKLCSKKKQAQSQSEGIDVAWGQPAAICPAQTAPPLICPPSPLPCGYAKDALAKGGPHTEDGWALPPTDGGRGTDARGGPAGPPGLVRRGGAPARAPRSAPACLASNRALSVLCCISQATAGDGG